MSFDFPRPGPRRIAIVGSGVSGLSAAWFLSRHHHVTLFESKNRLGGHARTVVAGRNGDQPVDTGFIVFNYANYPHLTRLFNDLDVPVEHSDMSFGATIDAGRLEYGLKDLGAVFGQRRSMASPRFWGMLRDIARFNSHAEVRSAKSDMTLGELVDDMRLGSWFRDYYLMPICGAIWSTPSASVGAFPARSLLRFFRNHALLSHTGQHQWWTVSGGSVEYVRRLEAALVKRGVSIRTNAPVQAVSRAASSVSLRAHGCEMESFDDVVFACHSDEALAMMTDPSTEETAALSALRYQDNHAFLHADASQMPRRKRCWSSWVYQSTRSHNERRIGVTYWMNRLQNIPEDDPLFVTLNPASRIREELIYDQKTFRHPVFDAPALKAQTMVAAMQGHRHTWFAGAYLRHGFHEDGIATALRVARGMEQATVQ